MSAPVFDRPAVDWERGRGGRPKIKPPVGETWPPDAKGRVQATREYTRVTTFAGALDNGHALGEWKARQAVLGMGRRPDYVARAASLTGEDRDKADLQELADKAREAAGPNKADLGSALHAFTERMDRGEELGHVPDAYVRHLDQYRTATQLLRFTHFEVRTVNDVLEVAGTPDRFGYCSVPDPDGVVDALRVIDTKTGRVDYPGKILNQLAIYWGGPDGLTFLYDPASGARTPLPELKLSRWGIVVHLNVTTGDCELLWVPLELGWRGALLAGPVRQWTSDTRRADLLVPVVPREQPATGEPGERPSLAPPEVAALHAARSAIVDAPTTSDLGQLWQRHAAEWKDSQELVALLQQRHTELAEEERLRGPRAALVAALRTAANQDTLADLWGDHGHTELWTDEHHAAARARHAELEQVTAA